MTDRSTKTVMWIMLTVILVLLLFIAYTFLIRPAYTGFVTDQQIAGYQVGYQQVVNDLITQLQQTGYVQLNIGNQTIILAPVQPTTQPQVQPIG